MLPQLSIDSVKSLANGETANWEQRRPVLQIIGLRKLPGSAVEDRYRVMLSDGVDAMTSAMLTTQPSALVDSGELDNNSIVRLEQFNCCVREDKRLLIILKLTVLKKGAEVNKKIGNPRMYHPSQADTKPKEQPGTSERSTPVKSNTSRFDSPIKRASMLPTTSSSPQPSNSNPVINSPGASTREKPSPNAHCKTQQTCPVARLNPYQPKWTILARVTSKTPVRDWSNQRGTGSLFSCTFTDESGEIRATAFNKEVDAFYTQLVEGKLYYVSRGALKPANKRFSSVPHDYELTLNSSTTISLADDSLPQASAIPVVTLNWLPIADLRTQAIDSVVDVLGVVHSYQSVQDVVARATGKVTSKRELQIVDESKLLVTITLWSKEAINFEQLLETHGDHPILGLKGARVMEFQQRVQLSMLPSSQLLVNPSGVDKVASLRRWYDSFGASDNLQPLTTGIATTSLDNSRNSALELVSESIRSPNTPWRVLKNVDANSGDITFFAKAMVVFVFKKGCTYRACTADGCMKKLIQEQNGRFRCDKCQKITTEYANRYLVTAQIADATDSAHVIFFNEAAETLIGCTPNELVNLQDSDSNAYDNLFANLHGKEFIFKLRSKLDHFQSEQRLRLACIGLMPVREADYIVHLINDIKGWKKK